MNIQKEFTVRYRNEGHVRFQIPERLCNKAVAKIIGTEILKIKGVYKVDLFKRQRKISIRYKEVVCEFKQLAVQMFQLLTELEEKGLLVAPAVDEQDTASEKWALKSKVQSWKATRWANEKYDDAKDTLKAAKIITKLGLKKSSGLMKDPEKAIVDFSNDILVLYLIKLHWVRITKEWLPSPWAFRYQWTAVFYLFYLLMRSRKPKPK